MAKRKTGERYANGKLKKPTAAERAAREAELYRANMQQVAGQPHRREFADPLDPWLESELGRFCRRNKLRRECFEAGEAWADLHRRYHTAKGAPDPLHTGGMGSGAGPSPEQVEKWGEKLREVVFAVQDVNQAALYYTRRLCINREPVPPGQQFIGYATQGLVAAAVALGLLDGKVHPYERAA
jgi:hypothetical protein